jgi:hypothetical protein
MIYKNRFAVTLFILALGAVGTLVVARALRKPTPVHLADTTGTPVEVTQRGDAWYWIERPDKGKARLVRAARSGIETVATADAIVGYDVDQEQIAWTARDDRRWMVMVGPVAGQKRAAWTGAGPAGSPSVRGNRVVWAVTRPGFLPEDAPMAALGPSVQVWMEVEGRAKPLATLLEASARMIGLFGDRAYIAAERNRLSGTAVLYEVTLTDGKWRRVTGEQGLSSPVARADETLFWVARSQDSSSRGEAACVRSIAPRATLSTNADWLPPRGQLFVAGSDIYYVDSEPHPAAWQIRTNAELVTPLTLPADYSPVAVGQSEFLLRSDRERNGVHRLFVMSRP